MALSGKSSVFPALLLIVAVIGGHLLPGLDNSRVENGLRNGMHIIVFATLASIIYFTLRPRGKILAVVLSILAAGSIGLAAEFTQSVFGRQLDYWDVGRDLAGAILATLAWTLWEVAAHDRSSVAMSFIARVSAAGLTLGIVAPFSFWIAVTVSGVLAQPVITDFSAWWHPYIFHPVNAEIYAPIDASGGARIDLQKRGRSGLALSPLVTDWAPYDQLVVEAQMLIGERANVTVRLNDGHRRGDWSDQFDVSIEITDAASPIRIPLLDFEQEPGLAPLDRSDIREIVFFVRDRRQGTVMRLQGLRLE